MASNNPIFRGSTGLTAIADSEALNYSDRLTYTQVFRGPKAASFTFIDLHYKGSIWSLSIYGSSALNFVVDSATLEPERGGIAKVTVNYTLIDGLTVPVDQFNLSPFEDNPPIEKNPYFASLTNADLQKAKASYEAASAAGQTSVNNIIATVTHSALITALVNKWLKGEQTYYLAAMKFQHTLHSYSQPTAVLGGFRQTPTGSFSSAAPGSMSWLRLADELSWDNGVWKLTRTWLGATGTPGWDSDLYP